MTIKGNKGEWSEIYAFLRLLADGKLFAADDKLNRICNMYFPIMKIIREETKGVPYEYQLNTETAEVEVYINSKQVMKISTIDFDIEAKRLLKDIKDGKGRSFEFPDTEAFFRGIFVKKLKAPSYDKSDINIEIHDMQTGYENTVGFSIKSILGSPSTLLNPSGATNFIYRIEGLDSSAMSEINSINSRCKFKDRIKAITDNGGRLVFDSMENDTFRENLIMIDTQMPRIVAEMLIGRYTEKATDCVALSEYVSDVDPLGISGKHYTHKIKEMLSAVALGMKPTAKWNGEDEATGGYIVVKSDGEVLAYHIYNRDAFKKYLLDNTKLDKASGKRYGHCELYEEEGGLRIKLNLQIRFI